MQFRVGWAAVLACALMTSCYSPPAQVPRPRGTLEPSITASSSGPTKPPPNEACKLLTAKERTELVGISMNAQVRVRPVEGTQECIWTHSLSGPARTAIRVVALDGAAWAGVARPQLRLALAHPLVSRNKSLTMKLRAALRDLAAADGLTEEQICEIYMLFAESRGMNRAEDTIFSGSIGSLPAVFGASCNEGRIVFAGYGEYGLRSSIALNHAVLRLVEVVDGRAEEVLANAADQDPDADDTDTDDAEQSPGQEDETDTAPSPEPSPDEVDDADAEDEGES